MPGTLSDNKHRLTPEGLAAVVHLLCRDGGLVRSGIVIKDGEPLEFYETAVALKPLAEQFLARNKAKGILRNRRERAEAVLMCIFLCWLEHKTKPN